MNAAAKQDRTAEFVRLFTQHSRQIYWSILAAVPRTHDADEIFQETNVMLWEKFEEFAPESNFLAWARKVAHFKVLEYHHRQRRDDRVFSQEMLEAVAAETERQSSQADARRQYLAECLAQLAFPDRQLIQRRYAPGATVNSLAEQIGRSVKTVYGSLARIHQALFDCVTGKLQNAAAGDAGEEGEAS